MSQVTTKDLFDNAVQFGHKKSYWNPKMKEYIFAEKNGVHILDLEQTKALLEEACTFLQTEAASGKTILFVGSKPQASSLVTEMAKNLKQPYVTKKWPGGLLTNWSVFKERINDMKNIRAGFEDGSLIERYTKKEVAKFKKDLEKLEKNLGGVEQMTKRPDVVFVVDPHNEDLAIKEANLCHVPVVAIVDTNANPDGIAHLIPANDDSRKSLKFILGLVEKACSVEKKKQDNVKKMD